MTVNRKTAIVIGAGPAGLTAAYEMLEKTDIKPIVYEMTSHIGGISKTVNYKGNRIDIGGHRFFSKSERVTQWWLNILPLQGALAKDDIILGRDIELSSKIDAPDPEKDDRVMLIRNRLSRVFFLRKFFDYPVSLNIKTFLNLGFGRTVKIALSYAKIRLFPIRDEKSLEDFFINRFGKELYLTFFKDYTEKVWGIPCNKIAPEWGAQRIKGLSISRAITDALRRIVLKNRGIDRKNIETSLIRQFVYPKFGPGQMWEEVARLIQQKGGKVHLRRKVRRLLRQSERIIGAEVEDVNNGKIETISGDYFFSSMAVRDLIESFGQDVDAEVRQVAQGIKYRDFITVGLLLRGMKLKNETKIKTINNIIPDNWIYIQEDDVKVGRLQIFNNWSPYMVSDANTVWIGLEYFCNEGDELWSKSDEDFAKFATDELASLGMIERKNVLDSVVIHTPKAYPAYFGSYDRFDTIRQFTDRFENLFLIGRNGMHRYNNQDHSMLAAMFAVENILHGIKSKDNIWQVNAEKEYHESK